MKKLLMVISIFTCSALYSQNTSIGEYEVIFQNNLVEVSLAEGLYLDNSRNLSHSRHFLQYKNMTSDEVEVTIQKELHYGNRCYGCEQNEESYKIIVIPGNTTLSYNQENSDKRFYFFVKDNNGLIKHQLTDFEIKIIKIQ